MRRPDNIPAFSKALLAGVLTGIAATVANLIYNVAFRGITNYQPTEEFNFFSITLASIILLTLIGALFFVFVKNVNSNAFTVFMIILVAAVVLITAFVHADKTEPAFYGNHGLIAGFTLITGILSITLLPYLFKHPKLFI